MRRPAAGLVAGVAGSLTAASLLPELPSPGLRGVLVVLPAVAALVACVAGRIGARDWPADERWALAAVLVLAGGHARLGFPGSDHLAVLSLFALLALRTLRLAPALVRHVGRRRSLASLFGLPLAVYLALLPWTGAERPPDGDEPYYLLLAESLASDFDVDLADEYAGDLWRQIGDRRLEPQPGDPTGDAGEVFSRHEPLLPLLLAPFWAAAGVPGARFAMLLLAAGWSVATLGAVRALGARPRGAVLAWMAVSFLPPALIFSNQIWVEVPAALLAALALIGLARLRARPGAWGVRDACLFALPLLLLPLVKLRFLALAAPLGLAALLGPRGRSRLRLAAGVAVVAAGLLVLIANALIWGNPLRMHAVGELALFDIPLARFLRGGSGLFFDVAFGLFAAAPLWMLAIPGVARAARRRGVLALALAVCLPYLVLVASRREWYGGWAPAFRYGFVLLPLLTAALALRLERPLPRGLAGVAVALGGLTAFVTAALVVEPGWATSLAAGSSSLLDRLSAGVSGDLIRFFPSSVRPRPATWAVPLVALAFFALSGRLGRGLRRPAGGAGASGAALLMVAAALLVVAANRLPTRVAELEDAWIPHATGALWPQRWTIDRTRFPGGWVIREGSRIELEPVSGGDAVTLTVHWMPNRPARKEQALEVLAGDRSLGRFVAPAGGAWRTSRVAADAWRHGDRLVLRSLPVGGGPPGSIVLDKVEFDWR